MPPDAGGVMQKEYAIYANDYGDTSVLKYKQMPIKKLAAHEVKVRNYYSDVNCTDIRFRTGHCRLPSLPSVLGIEGVGVIESVGKNVKQLHVGQHVAYAGLSTGSYASANHIPAERLIALPSSLPSDVVASTLLRGIAAYMLLTETYQVKSGDVVLVRSGNTSLALILMQWLKLLGAIVITYDDRSCVGSIDYIIDSMGGDGLMQNILALKPGGTLAHIGQVEKNRADDVNSLLLERDIHFYQPKVTEFMQDNAKYHQAANAVLTQLQQGLCAKIDTIIPFAEVHRAHQRLESRRATGAILLDTGIVRN